MNFRKAYIAQDVPLMFYAGKYLFQDIIINTYILCVINTNMFISVFQVKILMLKCAYHIIFDKLNNVNES